MIDPIAHELGLINPIFLDDFGVSTLRCRATRTPSRTPPTPSSMSSTATPSQSANPPTAAADPASTRAEEPAGGAATASHGARDAISLEVSVATQSAALVATVAENPAPPSGVSKARGAMRPPDSAVEASAGKATPAVEQAAVARAPDTRAEGSRGLRRAAAAGPAPRQKNNVRKIRIERMMSKAELARRANLSVLTIDRIEKGFGCRMDTKRKILEALGLSLDDRVRVFGEEE